MAFDKSKVPLFSASYPAVPAQVNAGLLFPSAISPIIFLVDGFASTVTPVCIIASPFITWESIFPVSNAFPSATVRFFEVMELPSVTLVLSTEYPLVTNVPPLSTIYPPFWAKIPTPSPPNSIFAPLSKLTVALLVTIAPTPFAPFSLISAPLSIVTVEALVPSPPFPI